MPTTGPASSSARRCSTPTGSVTCCDGPDLFTQRVGPRRLSLSALGLTLCHGLAGRRLLPRRAQLAHQQEGHECKRGGGLESVVPPGRRTHPPVVSHCDDAAETPQDQDQYAVDTEANGSVEGAAEPLLPRSGVAAIHRLVMAHEHIVTHSGCARVGCRQPVHHRTVGADAGWARGSALTAASAFAVIVVVAVMVARRLGAGLAGEHAGTLHQLGVGALVLLGIAAWAGGYALSLRIHPYTRCGKCQGGRVRGRVYSRSFGLCRHCGGTGRKPRLGVRLFVEHR